MNNYIERIRIKSIAAGKRVTHLQVVLSVIASRKWQDGLTMADHYIDAVQLMMPNWDMHEWRKDIIKEYCRCVENGIKEMVVHGASDSNKSSTFAALGLVEFFANPSKVSVYLTSPYKDSTDCGIFSALIDIYQDVIERHPYLPGKYIESQSRIKLENASARSGIRVVTADKIGKLVGRKAKDPTQGRMIFMFDEAPAFEESPKKAVLQLLNNIITVNNMIAMFAGNFAEQDDLLGAVSIPAIPMGYSGLDIEKDVRWVTTRGGVVLRLDGHRSPNILAGVDKYLYVTTISYLSALEKINGGKNSPGYLRFGRSFPCLSADEKCVLNRHTIRTLGGYDDINWSAGRVEQFAFLDPGFGGDPCVCVRCFVGSRAILDNVGRTVAGKKVIYFPPECFNTILLDVSPEAGETVEKQIANGFYDWVRTFGIPAVNCGFDPSMRGAITKDLLDANRSFTPLDSNLSATDTPMAAVGNKKQTARDEYFNINTEQHFNVRTILQGRQLCGLQFCEKAVQQLCKRKWYYAGKKKKVQGKDEFKSSNNGESPNEADALVGCIRMVVFRGMVNITEIIYGISSNQQVGSNVAIDRVKSMLASMSGKRIDNTGKNCSMLPVPNRILGRSILSTETPNRMKRR